LGRGPKESRETLDAPDVLSRGTWDFVVELRPVTLDEREEAVLPIVRLRLRIVTVEGTALDAELPATELRGEERGGVDTGPGSLERAEWTRASRRAIWAVRERIWVRELEGGILWLVDLAGFVVDGLGAGVRSAALPVVAARALGARVEDMDVADSLGLGVML
jgi:hypothetical protein